jgi:hypothetical protein
VLALLQLLLAAREAKSGEAEAEEGEGGRLGNTLGHPRGYIKILG